MTDVRAKISEIGLRRIAQAIVVLAFLGLFAVMSRGLPLAMAVAGWFDGALGLVNEFETAHRIHMMADSLMWWMIVIGLLVQLRSPRRNVAAQVMVLVPFVGMLLAMALTDFWRLLPIVGIFGGLALLATILHPAGRDLVGSFDASRASRVLLALALVAAVPLVAYSATQVGLQTGAIEQGSHDHGEAAAHSEVHDEHIEFGHFMLMAALGFTLVGGGVLAGLRPPGWWLPAWLTGILTAFFGLLSVTFPETASSAGTVWGVAAIAWAVAFVAAAEVTQDAETPSLLGEVRERTETGA